MPNYDGTGPHGEGPMTGWGRGYCVVPLSNPKGDGLSQEPGASTEDAT